MSDKQLNARVREDLHNEIKNLSTDRKITMNTLVEDLLERGLKQYLESDISTDKNSYLTQDDLIGLEERLGKLESLIANSLSGQANSESDRINRLESLFDSLVATLERKLQLQEQRLTKGSLVESVPEVRNIPNLGTDPYVVGAELTTKEMLEYTKSNPNTKNAKRDIERGLKDYPNQVWEPIARGFWKRVK